MLRLLNFLVALLMALRAASPGEGYRLPRDLTPEHYWITLTPSFEDEHFLTNGSIRVLLNCANATKQVVFNTNSINIDKESLSLTHEGKKIPVVKQEYDEKKMLYRLLVNDDLVPGQNYYLSTNFSYNLNDNLEGFYRSSYTDKNGTKRWLATTQFSPINARRAFPCWDEPSFKALFDITLGRPQGYVSISNMPTYQVTPMQDRPGWFWDHHQTTLKMSTYLIAFIVTDLPGVDLPQTSNPHFKIWSREELQSDMKYVGDISPKIIEFLQDYFKIPFPLQKIDLFAVPDFGFGAMENWGLITFAETAIKTSQTIAHELAHQWFGNLVSPEWWEDLWLKEGFATFLGVTALDRVYPELNATDKWIVNELHHSMAEDSLKSSHPVSNPVEDPSKIWQAFDVISYEKGSSVLRMMSEFLGEEKFRRGLTIYLQKFAYSNARRVDLWESFVGVTDVDIATVMDSWVLQRGYPVLTVTRNYDEPSITISQERFLLNGEKDENALWHVPITYTFTSDKRDEKEVTWLRTKGNSLVIDGLPNYEWFLVNVNRTGYYRVNYDPKNWAMLTEGWSEVPRLSKAQLLDDSFTLAVTSRLDYRVPLSLAQGSLESGDQLLQNVTIVQLTKIGDFLTSTPLLPKFNEYCLSLFNSEEFSYNSEPKTLVKFASRLGQKRLVNESIESMNDLMNGKNLSFADEMLDSVYCNGVRENEGDKLWEFLWKKYVEESKPEEKQRIIKGLACSKDAQKLKRLLDTLLSDASFVRKQEAKTVFTSVANNEIGAGLALDFITDNWDKLINRFGLAYKIMSSMVGSLGTVLNQEAQLEKLKQLYKEKEKDLGSASNAFHNTLERIQININFLNYHYDDLQSIIINTVNKDM